MAAAQLSLPLDFAPEPVRDHGLRAAHLRPLVSPGKRAGRPFVSFRVPPERAWQYPELEYGNAGSSFAALVLDCDRPKAWRVGVCDLPPYSWLVLRPANDHGHILRGALISRCTDTRLHASNRCNISLESLNTTRTPLAPTRPIRACSPTTPPHYSRGHTGRLGVARSPTPSTSSRPSFRSIGNLQRYGRRASAGTSIYSRPGCDGLVARPTRACPSFRPCSPPTKSFNTLSLFRKCRRRHDQSRRTASGGRPVAGTARAGSRGRRHARQNRLAEPRKRSASPDGSNEALRPWGAEGVSRATWYRRRKVRRETVTNTDKGAWGHPCPVLEA